MGAFGVRYNLSPEERERRRIVMLRNRQVTGPNTDEWKGKISKAKLGKKFTPEHIRKLSVAKIGTKQTEEHKLHRSIAMVGGNVGKVRTPEMRLAQSLRMRGEKSPNWRGGINKQPYPPDWNMIRRTIRERDGNRCRVCGKDNGGRRVSVHHIDYNRNNNNELNLITLCGKCHGLTGFNRESWMSYFNTLLLEMPQTQP